MNIHAQTSFRQLFSLILLLASLNCFGQPVTGMAGDWVFNEDASDSTDKQVEAAMKAMGQKVKKRWFSKDKEFYRGGPEEQELYDRISYDRELHIEFGSNVYLFTYADNFQRSVFTDNRSRSVSLTGLDEVRDFSFAHWEGDKLLVEGRPRDGGFTDETYRLINDGAQLEASFYIMPHSFSAPIELKRIFDRQP